MIELRNDVDGTPLLSLVTEYAYTDVGYDGGHIGRWLISTTYGGDDPEEEELEWVDESVIEITDRNEFGMPTEVEDELGRVTLFVYDDLDRLVKVISPDPGNGQEQGVVEYAYLLSGLLEEVTQTWVGDIAPIVTRFEYDAAGRISDIWGDYEGADETHTQYEYDLVGNVERVLDPLGRETRFTYDILDRLVRVTGEDPDGEGILTAPVALMAYDALGRLIAERDPRQSLTRYEYDAVGNVERVFNPLGVVTSFSYDAAGQLIRATDAEGRVTGYKYDDAGRLTELHLPNPHPSLLAPNPFLYQYDSANNLRFVTDPLGRETEFEYDERHRLTKTLLPAPDPGAPTVRPETTYTYFDDGQIESVTERLSVFITRTTSYTYDDAGRLESVTLPDPDGNPNAGLASPVYEYLYDPFGNVAKITDPLGNRTEFQYDRLHRVTKVIEEHPTNNAASGETGRPVTTYLYDDAGQLLEVTEKITDNATRTTSYVYDGLGRLIRSVQPDPSDGDGIYTGTTPGSPDTDTPFTDYTYDAGGLLLSAKDAAGLGTSYAYDALGRRISATDANGDATTFTYDRVGNLLTLTDPEENTTTWEYDARNRVVQETNELDFSRYFSYDAVGNLTQTIDRNGRVIGYEYDPLNRLTTESWFADEQDVTADREIEFRYDLVGRLIYTTDPDHESAYVYARRDLDVATSTEYGYVSGLEPAFIFSNFYDAAGNLTESQALIGEAGVFLNSYEYDNLHRLTRVEQEAVPFGEAVSEKRVDFTYDLTGRFDSVRSAIHTFFLGP